MKRWDKPRRRDGITELIALPFRTHDGELPSGATPELPTDLPNDESFEVGQLSRNGTPKKRPLFPFFDGVYIMALARGLTTISTRKRKVKITKSKLAQYELDWRAHNKWAKRHGMHDLKYNTVDEYINYCLGKVKPKAEFKPYTSEDTYHRETPNYPSAKGTGGSCGTKKESPKYTGTFIKGIATMHKSNAVPITNQEQATEISRMAR